MYCPPPGALQFLLEPRPLPNGAIADVVINTVQPIPIWVEAAVSGNASCGCKTVYPVLLDSLSPEYRDLVEDALDGRPQIFVCSHAGSIIE